jgi:hypothetical protein
MRRELDWARCYQFARRFTPARVADRYVRLYTGVLSTCRSRTSRRTAAAEVMNT